MKRRRIIRTARFATRIEQSVDPGGAFDVSGALKIGKENGDLRLVIDLPAPKTIIHRETLMPLSDHLATTVFELECWIMRSLLTGTSFQAPHRFPSTGRANFDRNFTKGGKRTRSTRHRSLLRGGRISLKLKSRQDEPRETVSEFTRTGGKSNLSEMGGLTCFHVTMPGITAKSRTSDWRSNRGTVLSPFHRQVKVDP